MKKFFASALVALSLVAFVACGNPAIKAAEKFIKNPTAENAAKAAAEYDKLDADEKAEYDKWATEHANELMEAAMKAGEF